MCPPMLYIESEISLTAHSKNGLRSILPSAKTPSAFVGADRYGVKKIIDLGVFSLWEKPHPPL